MQSTLYPPTVGSTESMVAYVDAVSESGLLLGWALYLDIPAICHVQARIGGQVVAEDMADKFRRDLLAAGLGFGYCAFYIQLPILPGKADRLELCDGRTGVEIWSGRSVFDLPRRWAPVTGSVERLLQAEDRWNEDDIREHYECLKLAENLGYFGAERFVDRVFRFALGRWADPGGLAHYSRAINSGSLTPEQVLVAILSSEERRRNPRPLPSPLEPSFPFLLNPPGGPYRRYFHQRG